MRIHSLKLQNIRSYIEETIIFPEGSLLLAGDIGAGKSTILLAIEYALFGTKRGELESSSLLRNGTQAGRIELCFDINNSMIKIGRTLKRTPLSIKQDAGYIVINNKRIDATPVELRARVMELLGYPKDAQSLTKDLIYRYTVFTPQEQMRQIIYENKETRLNTLRKIFNIDKYKKIKENAQLIAKELRMKKRLLDETVTDISPLEEKRKLFIQLHKEKEGVYAQEFLQLQQVQETKTRCKTKIEATEVQQKKLHELRQQHSFQDIELKKIAVQQIGLKQKQHMLIQQKEALRSQQISILENPSEKSRSVIELEKEMLEKEINELQQAKNSYIQQKKSIEEKFQILQKTSAVLQQTLSQKQQYEQQFQDVEKIIILKSDVQLKIAECEQQLQQCHEHKAAADVLKFHATKTINALAALDVCTLCLQTVDHEHKEKIIFTQTQQMQETEEKLSSIIFQEQQNNNMLVKLKEQFNEILISEQKKASLTIILQNLTEKEKEYIQKKEESILLEQQLKELKPLDEVILQEKQTQVIHLKGLLQKIVLWETALLEQKNRQLMIADKELQQKEIEVEQQHLAEAIIQIQQQQQVFQQQLLELKDVEITLEFNKQELQKIHDIEKNSEILLATISKELQYIAEQQEHLILEIEKINNVLMKMKRINATIQWFEDYFIPLVSTMEKHVLLQVHSSFNSYFTSWFGTLMGDSMTARLDENFTPVVEQNGYETDIVDLSGGEKTAVALSYRLALNKVVNDFISTITTKDFIILDEPTEGFSSEQLDTVRDVLDALGLKQVILVSHEQKIESFVEHIIRIEKQGHVSKIIG
ncbi:MAG: SMC family ATPase [Candidatus Woesearchaeota archaeon]|jgi:exonuclease SbcC